MPEKKTHSIIPPFFPSISFSLSLFLFGARLFLNSSVCREQVLAYYLSFQGPTCIYHKGTVLRTEKVEQEVGKTCQWALSHKRIHSTPGGKRGK